jgi:sortase (surface protein transpeptidase)
MIRLVTALLAGLFLLAGCGGDGGSPLSPIPFSDSPRTEYAAPVSIDIPSVDISSEVKPISMNAAKVLDVSSLDAEPLDTGWYDRSAKVGQRGPMIMAAHVNYNGPGAFGRLSQVSPGAQVHVTDDRGVVKTYVITRVAVVDKDEFPTNQVYGRTDGTEIRLITCGGAFNNSRRVGDSEGSYEQNVIAFGKLA